MNDPYAAFGRPVDAAPRQEAAPRRQPRPAMPQIRFADDRDAIIRTVLGEAGSEPEIGRQAVAAVIQNRARTRGLTPAQVVLERNQFEPWGNPETAARLMSYTPDSPEYQEVARQIDAVLQGYDPTGGASHFYSPSAQAALGRPAPSWDDGSGFEIGRHRFFRLEGQPEAQQTAGDPFAAYGRPVEDAPDAVAQEGGLDLGALIRGEDPNEVVIDRGYIIDGGNVYTLNKDNQRVLLGSEAEWEALPEQEREGRFRAAVSGRSPEYVAEYNAARARSENVPALLENLVQGGTLGAVPLIEGALGWLDPNVEGIGRGLASQAARDAARDRQASLLREDPLGTIGAQLAGGLLTPGLKATGNYIAGAQGAARTGRAAAVGAGYGGAAGLIGGEGDLGERIPQGLLGAGTGAATGGILDAGARRAFAGAANRLNNPSAQRRLSREGVDLTPGQMLEPTPVIGPMLRGVEDGMTGVPLAGAVVQGARNRGIETFNVAAINRALEPIGQRLPRNVKPGYEAVEEAQRRLGQAYSDILPQITAQLDQPLYDDIARVLDDAAAEMPEDRLAQLARVLQNRVFRNVDQSDATISGEQFKRIESELGALARQYRTANDPAAVSFSEAVTGIQNALRDMIARQNPAQADRLRQINRGYANLVRVERAAGSTAAQATEGVFSPTQLGVAVAQGSTRAARANEGALLQDLAVAGRGVLPSKVGDSGTATRGAITGLLAGGAALVNPTVAVPAIAVTVGAYSKPAQAALNAIYRATDRRTADSALGELQRFAARNPALQPYYADAVLHVQRVFQSQEQGQEPRARGLLSPTPPAQAVP